MFVSVLFSGRALNPFVNNWLLSWYTKPQPKRVLLPNDGKSFSLMTLKKEAWLVYLTLVPVVIGVVIASGV